MERLADENGTASAVNPTMSARSSKRSSKDLAGSVYLISSDGRMLSLPIPSTSPLDPLTWTLGQKAGVVAITVYYSIISLTSVQTPGIMFKAFLGEFSDKQMKPFHVQDLSSSPTLCIGIGAVIWIPLSLAIGRRPVFLLSAIILFAGTAWTALSSNFYELLVGICLQGLGAGATLSTLLLVLIDLTYIHQRPQILTAYWCGAGSLALVVLSLLPFMTDVNNDWRSFYQIWTVPTLIAPILVFLFVPETYFLRPPVAFDGRVLVQSGTEKVRIYEDWDEVPGGKPLPEEPMTSFFKWLKQRRIFRRNLDWKAMAASYPQIVLCLCNPLVFWVLLLNSLDFGAMMSIGVTFPSVLSAPPHSLSPRAISLVNLAAAGGALAAWPASCLVLCRITKRLTLRNKGVRHAEYYLPAFLLPILSGAASVFIYGFAAERQWPAAWTYVAYALNTFSSLGLGVANTMWVTEALPRWAAPALAVVGGISYIASWGISGALPRWLEAQGYIAMNVEIGAAILVVGLIGIPLAFRGRDLRQHISTNGFWGAFEGGALRPQ